MSKHYLENGIRIRTVKRPTSRKARKRFAELARRKAKKDAALYANVIEHMLEGSDTLDSKDGTHYLGMSGVDSFWRIARQCQS